MKCTYSQSFKPAIESRDCVTYIIHTLLFHFVTIRRMLVFNTHTLCIQRLYVVTLTVGCRYDGDVVEEFNKSTATHIVCTPDEGDDESSTGQESISAEWLWKCIKKKKLVRQ